MSGGKYLEGEEGRTWGRTQGSALEEELKYSMVENEGEYNVQWDPEILADLQANVHRN